LIFLTSEPFRASLYNYVIYPVPAWGCGTGFVSDDEMPGLSLDEGEDGAGTSALAVWLRTAWKARTFDRQALSLNGTKYTFNFNDLKTRVASVLRGWRPQA